MAGEDGLGVISDKDVVNAILGASAGLAGLTLGRAPWSGGNESVVVILSDGAGGQATSSLCARSTSFGFSSCPVS